MTTTRSDSNWMGRWPMANEVDGGLLTQSDRFIPMLCSLAIQSTTSFISHFTRDTLRSANYFIVSLMSSAIGAIFPA
ncbi:hypothetical protein COLO4_35055 [Corchorus olitorius]|uniref:Uncharacterized protein n=1 Tax=Corchorus olitorius TaxID=93759 RepID=A0A1R3GI81_9ROSI|nr:hypothetical protein COLO4_35055 [Corchorus olitorius]